MPVAVQIVDPVPARQGHPQPCRLEAGQLRRFGQRIPDCLRAEDDRQPPRLRGPVGSPAAQHELAVGPFAHPGREALRWQARPVQQVDQIVADRRGRTGRRRAARLRYRRRAARRGALVTAGVPDAEGEGGGGRLRAGLDHPPAGTGGAPERVSVRERVRPGQAGRRPEPGRIAGLGGIEGQRAQLGDLGRLTAGEGFSPR